MSFSDFNPTVYPTLENLVPPDGFEPIDLLLIKQVL